MKKGMHTLRAVFFYLAAFLMSLTLLILKVQFDNVYTVSCPQASNGLLQLSATELEDAPLLFLRDGWAFYQYQFLSPAELAQYEPEPTAYLFLGQYGGFELDDPSASPHGSATYRLVIETDDPPPVYTLELPDTSSRYCLWINGRAVYRSGIPGLPDIGSPADAAVTFPGAERVELVVAMMDHESLFSGMRSPPAFGLPGAVTALLNLRLAYSAALASMGVLAAGVCLFFFFSKLRRSTAGLLALLHLFFLCSVSSLLPRFLPVPGPWLIPVQRLGYYGAMGLIVYLQAHYAGMPRRWRWLLASLGLTFCCWVVVFPALLLGSNYSVLLFFSRTLDVYKWLSAVLLLLSGLYTAGHHAPRRFLLGACVFAAALLVDRAFPLFEPILLFCPVQAAVLFNVILVVSGFVTETVQIFQAYAEGVARERDLRLLINARQEQYRQLSMHIDRVRTLKHEMRGFLLQMRYYLAQQDYHSLQRQLSEQIGALTRPCVYTGHPLLDALLSHYAGLCAAQEVDLTIDAVGLPRTPELEDADLTALVSNLLQNALEAACLIPSADGRWIRFTVRQSGGYLKLRCQNSKQNPIRTKGGRIVTGKADPDSHGLGLVQVQHIADRCHGMLRLSYDRTQFTAEVMVSVFPAVDDTPRSDAAPF